MSTSPRPASVDLDELCIAFDSTEADLSWYLDRQTGRVFLINSHYEPGEDGPSRRELKAHPARYIEVPRARPEDLQGDVQAFAESVEDLQLRETLEIALAASGPMRRFKSVLTHLPEWRERWYAFKRRRLEERVDAWLKQIAG